MQLSRAVSRSPDEYARDSSGLGANTAVGTIGEVSGGMTGNNDRKLLSATIESFEGAVRACLEDRRQETVVLFDELGPAEREKLAEDAWSIGLRALSNAYSQARESRLEDVGKTLLSDMERQVRGQLELQERAIGEALRRFFDPKDGQVTRRLDAFLSDQGALARFLRSHLGSEGSVLARTLAQQVGENSELFKKRSPTEKEGIVQILEERLSAVMEENQRELFKALDPFAEDGAVARLLRTLREELETADEDRAEQLTKALAALDSNDPSSLISQLGRETRDAKATLLRALNPQDPESPIAAVRKTVETMLEAHGQSQLKLIQAQEERQKQLEILIRESVARLESRKQAEESSPRGGATFEDAVVRFVEDATHGGTYIVEATGNTTGLRRACKVGDVIVSFTNESAFHGCRVVVEAKRDASYTVAKALQEMEVAKENRAAGVGVFVLSQSHAPKGFPEFARYGSTILVLWDAEDPQTDATLRAALLAGLAMVTRRRSEADHGDLEALQDVEKRIQDELNRITKMRKANDKIASSSDVLRDELRKAERKFELLLDKAKETLRALNVELVEEREEVASPISLPESRNEASLGVESDAAAE